MCTFLNLSREVGCPWNCTSTCSFVLKILGIRYKMCFTHKESKCLRSNFLCQGHVASWFQSRVELVLQVQYLSVRTNQSCHVRMIGLSVERIGLRALPSLNSRREDRLLVTLAQHGFELHRSTLTWLFSNKYCNVFFKDFTYLFWGRGKEGEKRKKCINVQEIHRSCDPDWEPGPQARRVPWPGIKLTTLKFAGHCSIYWATPARAVIYFLVPHDFLNIFFSCSLLYYKSIIYNFITQHMCSSTTNVICKASSQQ